eukprot:15454540-Alexandrium_andersonii.AAC.1
MFRVVGEFAQKAPRCMTPLHKLVIQSNVVVVLHTKVSLGTKRPRSAFAVGAGGPSRPLRARRDL